MIGDPKPTSYRNKKILQSAKGETCTMNLPGVCNNNPETTVWAHSNYHEHGKGAGTKADDIFGCYACDSCHAVFDGHQRPPKYAQYLPDRKQRFIKGEFIKAMHVSIKRLLTKGILK